MTHRQTMSVLKTSQCADERDDRDRFGVNSNVIPLLWLVPPVRVHLSAIRSFALPALCPIKERQVKRTQRFPFVSSM